MPPKRKFGGGAKKGGNEGPPIASWDITDRRKLSISTFTGDPRVDIREFYEKDGEKLPSGKGLLLTVEQWKKVLKLAPQVEEKLREVGAWEEDEEEDEEEKPKKKKRETEKNKEKEEGSEDEEEEEAPKKKKRETKKKVKSKEVVSDEEEEDDE